MIVMDLSLASPAGSLALATVVTIIDSYVSCDNSKVTVIPNEVTLPRSSHLVVRFLANDADNMPVNYTQGEIEFRWAGQPFPSTWARGRNEYIADVPRQWTDVGGQYELTVGIRHSWNASLGLVESCVVFRRMFAIEGDTQQTILASVLGAVLVVFVVSVAWFVRRSATAWASLLEFVLAFLRSEGLLALEISLGLWDIAGDCWFLVEVRKQSRKGWVSRVWIPYVVFFSLACLVSTLALGAKLVLLVQTVRSRVDGARDSGAQQRPRTGFWGRQRTPRLKRQDSAILLKE
jgi:hypothetical protein